MNNLELYDPELLQSIKDEENRQKTTLELIASENIVSPNVQYAAGSVLTNKYAEGYPGARYYGGCEFVDVAENLAIERAKQLFNCEYANVQPHSGSQANLSVFNTLLKPGDTILGMDLSHGGHLTHGSPVNFSGKYYNVISYGVDQHTGIIDYNDVYEKANIHKPKLIIAGGSAYSRLYDFPKFREIADSVGAFLWADIAHPAGLVAAGVHPTPIPYCDVVTTTTHKTLRGPRGGMVLIGKDIENKLGVIAPKSGRIKNISELFNSTVMPGIQGGPLMHIIAAKAVAFKEALSPDFKKYANQIINNAKKLSDYLKENDFNIISGGTDNHVILIDLSNKKITGKEAENRLHRAGITVNKNMVPFDKESPFVTSGIRIGTPALTTRGLKEDDMKFISNWINAVIEDESNVDNTKKEIHDFASNFPMFAW